ncbi:MAG TPA: NAD(P)H-dependent oxidoreductase subunit E, partial [Acidimicrobiales bacterium]|nr:NAD(P)H-dependent oxidoreductase subunit E [Acidimicrobiales bacterium]
MDLKAIETGPTDAEREAVDALLGPPETSWEGGLVRSDVDGHAARGGLAQVSARRRQLLPALQAVQARVGWISPGALGYLCRRLEVPPAEAYGVASFYALFSLEPHPPVVAHVCDDIACLVGGAAHLCAALEETVGPAGNGEGTGNGKAPPGEGSARFTWSRSPCLGLCDRAPAALVVGAGPEARQEVLAPTSPEEVAATCAQVADAVAAGDHRDNGAQPRAVPPPVAEVPQAGSGDLRLLARAGRYDPGSVDDYRSRGGYQALRRAVTVGPEGVLAELAESNLLGRGGAAFPIGRKWDSVARAPDRPHYLVCNADESEPGTFKDRILMESDPFAVVESIAVACVATGSEKAFVYVRAEYPL